MPVGLTVADAALPPPAFALQVNVPAVVDPLNTTGFPEQTVLDPLTVTVGLGLTVTEIVLLPGQPLLSPESV